MRSLDMTFSFSLSFWSINSARPAKEGELSAWGIVAGGRLSGNRWLARSSFVSDTGKRSRGYPAPPARFPFASTMIASSFPPLHSPLVPTQEYLYGRGFVGLWITRDIVSPFVETTVLAAGIGTGVGLSSTLVALGGVAFVDSWELVGPPTLRKMLVL